MSGKKMVFDFKIDLDDYRESVMCVTFGAQRWKRIALTVTWVVATITFILAALKVIIISAPIYTCCLMVMVAVGGVWVSAMISIFRYKDVYRKNKGSNKSTRWL